MTFKHVVSKIMIAVGCYAGFACANSDVDNQYGTVGVEVTDGSELKLYNGLVELLKKHGTWVTLTSVRAGGPNDNFKLISAVAGTVSAIVSENGGAVIPSYPEDTLGLKNMAGFRAYAQKTKTDQSFIANDTTCGAAATFSYPSMVTTLLIAKRPAQLFNARTESERVSLYGPYYKGVQQDMDTLKRFCANQPNQKVYDGISALWDNLSSDIDRILPFVDKDYRQLFYPYTATITCGMNGQNMNVMACFKNTDLKIQANNEGKLYKIFTLGEAGQIDKDGLHIELPEHFSLEAQNSQRTLVLGITIKNLDGKVMYSDQQGEYGMISVKN